MWSQPLGLGTLVVRWQGVMGTVVVRILFFRASFVPNPPRERPKQRRGSFFNVVAE